MSALDHAERVRGIVENNPTAQINNAAEMVVRSRDSIIKAATQGLDPFTEIGTSGLRQFGGYVLEEWLAQLAGRKAAWVWREMKDNDPTVGAILFAIDWLARGVDWHVDEGNDAKAAELVESCMDDMSHTWGDTVSEILSMLPYGWALLEEVYKKRQGPQLDPVYDPNKEASFSNYAQEDDSHVPSSKSKDGLVGWRKLAIRAQETLLKWHFDGYSGVQAMEQLDWHGGDHIIPMQKSLLFRTRAARNNPEGRSILRNGYTSYFALKNIRQLEAIGVERDLAGIPVLTPPEGVDLFSAGQAALLSKVQRLITSIKRDDHEGVILPSDGWKFELMSSGGSRQFDTDTVIRRYRQDLASSMLADFVLVGMDAVGSYAMVDVKADLFGMALDGILDSVCEVFNRYAIPRLLRVNGMDDSEPPQIAHASAGRINLERVGTFLFQLAGSGAPIPWTDNDGALLRALFKEAGLPPNFGTLPEWPAVGPGKPPPGADPYATETHPGTPAPQPATGPDGTPQKANPSDGASEKPRTQPERAKKVKKDEPRLPPNLRDAETGQPVGPEAPES